MKHLIIALLITLPVTAQADTLAWMKSKSGGRIVLTDAKCDTQRNSFIAHALSPDSNGVRGCWFYGAEAVVIVWGLETGPETRVYEVADFTFTEAFLNTKKPENKKPAGSF